MTFWAKPSGFSSFTSPWCTISDAEMTRMMSMPKSASTSKSSQLHMRKSRKQWLHHRRDGPRGSTTTLPGGGKTVLESKLENVSANHQKKTPMGRSAAAATLVHSSSHLIKATYQ